MRLWHPAHDATNVSLEADKNGESVFDTGGIGGHPICFPTADLLVGEMPPHTALVGSSGAGKTIFQKMLMRAVLQARDGPGQLRYRAMVYDPKREFFPFLRALGIPAEQIIITHPFDNRSPAWDLAADFREPAQVAELSEMLIPKGDSAYGGDMADFFQQTARIIVQDLIQGLIKEAKEDWELRDVIEATIEPEYTEQILNKTPQGTRTWRAYFGGGDERLANSVRATLHTALSPFQTLASAWHYSREKFSLAKWLSGSGILLMGSDPEREGTLQQVNRLLFQRASQLLLAGNRENPVDLTWFFLDELREAGKLTGLRQILTQGRSKGARVVIGFQDMDGLSDLYGEKAAGEIVGLCANRIFLHLDNPGTRQWVSDFFAYEERLMRTQSRSGIFNTVDSNSEAIGAKTNVLPVELHDLPLASSKGVFGFYATPPRGQSYSSGKPQGERSNFHLRPTLFAEIIAIGEGTGFGEAFEKRSEEDQEHKPWDVSDYTRLSVKSAIEFKKQNLEERERVRKEELLKGKAIMKEEEKEPRLREEEEKHLGPLKDL